MCNGCEAKRHQDVQRQYLPLEATDLMFRFRIVFAAILMPVIAQGQGLTVRDLTMTRIVRPLDFIHYYNDDFLFASRGYGNGNVPGGQTEPGFFVNVKATNRWFQILTVSTQDAKLGRLRSDNPADQRLIMTVSVSWDYTGYASEPSIPLPLKTSGSISFPDSITYEPATQRFVLRFNTGFKIPGVSTTLYIKREELERAVR